MNKSTFAFQKLREWSNSFYTHLKAPQLSLKEQAALTKRMSFLLRGGMATPYILSLVGSQQRSSATQKIFQSISEDVEAGHSFADSLRKHPKLFAPFAIQIIHIGEASGAFAGNLAYLSEELEKRSSLRSKVLGALMYPALIGVFSIVMTVALVVFIFPKIVPVFSGLGVALPWPTRIVLGLSNYLTHWGFLTFGILATALLVVMVITKRNTKAQLLFSRFLLSVPIVRSLTRSYYLASISRTFSLLLTSGMTLRDAIPATAASITHPVYRFEFEKLQEAVEEGRSISETFGNADVLFPDLVRHMLSAGEASGTLPETLSYISEYYEHELDETTRRLSTLVEPVLMIGMGLSVGFVAISIILPIYEITQHLHA
ncbi:MAG: type II secretion system F family protein [Minisyncoccia bacterium]